MKSRPHRIALALVAAVATAHAASAAEAEEDLLGRYLELARRYRSGEPDRAAEALATWEWDDVQQAAVRFRFLLERGSPKAPHAAAVALHSEAGFLLRRWERHREADNHLDLAHRLVLFASFLDSNQTLGRVWYRTVGHHWTMHAFVGLAEDRLEEGLERFPDDAELWLARGAVHELIATIGANREDGQRARGQRRPQQQVVRRRPRELFERAAAAYEHALDLNPDLEAARLRLARTLHELGHLDEAEGELHGVLDEASGTAVQYLTHLFLGDLHESRGDLELAVDEYRAAVAIHAESSSGQLALSHALLRSGERRAAAASVRAALAAARRDDLWLSYLASAHEFEASIRELRQMVASSPR